MVSFTFLSNQLSSLYCTYTMESTQMYSWVLSQWGGSPVLCHVSKEGPFGFPYIWVIYGSLFTEWHTQLYWAYAWVFCPWGWSVSVLIYGPVWSQILCFWKILQIFSDRPAGYGITTFFCFFYFLPRVVLCSAFWEIWKTLTWGSNTSGMLSWCASVPSVFPLCLREPSGPSFIVSG